MHSVQSLHTRSLVFVGLVSSYCVALQVAQFLQTRSVVLVGAVAWYCEDVHVEKFRQVRSVEAVGATNWNWVVKQVVTALQTRFVDDVRGWASYMAGNSHGARSSSQRPSAVRYPLVQVHTGLVQDSAAAK